MKLFKKIYKHIKFCKQIVFWGPHTLFRLRHHQKKRHHSGIVHSLSERVLAFLSQLFFKSSLGNRFVYLQLLDLLKPQLYTSRTTHPSGEIHTLVAHHTVELSILSLQSLLSVTSSHLHLPIIIHDDGSLTSQDKNMLRKLFPQTLLVDYHTATTRVQTDLATFPHILNERKQLHTGWQIQTMVDVPLFSESEKILYLDTDLLFFKTPNEIIDWLRSTKESALFMTDESEAQVLSPIQVEQYCKTKYLPLFNMGILGYWTKTVEFREVDKYLQALQQHNLQPRFWREQTYWMTHIARHYPRRHQLNPQKYQLSTNSPQQHNQNLICRHYAGKSRREFYAAGIEWITTHA